MTTCSYGTCSFGCMIMVNGQWHGTHPVSKPETCFVHIPDSFTNDAILYQQCDKWHAKNAAIPANDNMFSLDPAHTREAFWMKRPQRWTIFRLSIPPASNLCDQFKIILNIARNKLMENHEWPTLSGLYCQINLLFILTTLSAAIGMSQSQRSI